MQLRDKRILVVEDEPRLASLLADYLRAEHCVVTCLSDGAQVLPWLAGQSADLLILDVMLPQRDGLTLCRDIRAQSSVPIILATARVSEEDRLAGLDGGADDYVCKPYSLREMVARVKVILRRLAPEAAAPASSGEVQLGPFRVAADGVSVWLNDQLLALTPVESRLLQHFLRYPQQVFSRDALLNVLYDDYRLVCDRTVDSHIKNLRKKLQTYWPAEPMIHAVYGQGYRFLLPS